MSEKVEALLFDLDGTLVDTEPATEAAITEVMAAYTSSYVKLSEEMTHGRTWRDIARTLAEQLGIAASEIERQLETTWTRLTMTPATIAGATEMLAHASSCLKVAVVSSSRNAEIRRLLGTIGADPYVHEIVGAEDVVMPKPDPEPFLVAARRFAITPHNCVVFEDSAAGVLAAKRAGMRVIGVRNRHLLTLGAQHVIDTWLDLPPAFIEQLAIDPRRAWACLR